MTEDPLRPQTPESTSNPLIRLASNPAFLTYTRLVTAFGAPLFGAIMGLVALDWHNLTASVQAAADKIDQVELRMVHVEDGYNQTDQRITLLHAQRDLQMNSMSEKLDSTTAHVFAQDGLISGVKNDEDEDRRRIGCLETGRRCPR